MENPRILITGATGMVGTALQKIIPEADLISSYDCDLRSATETYNMFLYYKPSHVIHLAARVGGVLANTTYMGEFYEHNMSMNSNVLESARLIGVEKVVSLLSTCVYPDKAEYPLTEDQIHNGPPHHSNFGYAYAKRMLDVQSRAYRQQYGCNYITVVPNNLFGEGDNFDLENSHVIPAIIRKVYEAKIHDTPVHLWGDGTPLREFTYSSDLAKILTFLLENYNEADPINVGNTAEFSIKDIVKKIVDIIGYSGPIEWDRKKPSGQLRKPSSTAKFKKLISVEYTELNQALKNTIEWFIMNYPNVRGVN